MNGVRPERPLVFKEKQRVHSFRQVRIFSNNSCFHGSLLPRNDSSRPEINLQAKLLISYNNQSVLLGAEVNFTRVMVMQNTRITYGNCFINLESLEFGDIGTKNGPVGPLDIVGKFASMQFYASCASQQSPKRQILLPGEEALPGGGREKEQTMR